MKPTVILGLGNVLMSDEGIGVRVVRRLESDPRLPSDAECIDLGTSGMSVVHEIAARRKAVIVDCAFMDAEPGTLRCFTPDEVLLATESGWQVVDLGPRVLRTETAAIVLACVVIRDVLGR